MLVQIALTSDKKKLKKKIFAAISLKFHERVLLSIRFKVQIEEIFKKSSMIQTTRCSADMKNIQMKTGQYSINRKNAILTT